MRMVETLADGLNLLHTRLLAATCGRISTMFHGPPIDDEAILERLPGPYAELLRSVNGYVAYHGGLHVRGACHQPTWHSLRYNWLGNGAIHKLYPALTPDDIPFAE